MDLSKIREGDKIKNYLALCKLINEPAKKGKSRQLQLLRWNRFFKFIREGNSYIIAELFAKPIVKNSNIGKMRNHDYIKKIESTILQMIIQHNGEISLPRYTLLLMLNMINENYKTGKMNIDKLSKYMNIGIEELQEFYDRSSKTLKGNLEKALNNLQDSQSLITWKSVKWICHIRTSAEYNSNGDLKVKGYDYMDQHDNVFRRYSSKNEISQEYRKATEEEMKKIRWAERQSMLDMGFNKKNEIVLSGKWNQYYAKVREYLEESMNISFYYDVYEIEGSIDHIELETKRLKETEIKEQLKLINKNVKDIIENNTNNRHIKARKKLAFGESEDKVLTRRSKPDYMVAHRQFIEMLLCSEYPNITKKIVKSR